MTQPATTKRSHVEPKTNHGDDDALAHIVMKEDQMKGYLSGEPIKALCGKVWVPSRDYAGLAICPSCEAERDRLIAGMKNLN